jgi:transposase
MEAMRERIAEVETQLAKAKSELEETRLALEESKSEHEKLRHSYRRVLEELQLMRRRLFVAKAERRDTSAEQLAFEGLLAEVQRLERAIDAAVEKAAEDEKKKKKGDKRPPKPKGRRNLAESNLPVQRVEILDPELEGHAERINWETSSRLGYQRGGPVHIVLARAVYKVEETASAALVEGEASQSEDAVSQPASAALATAGVARRVEDEGEASQSEDAVPQPASAAPATGGEAPQAELDASSPRRTRLVTAPLPKELSRRGLLAPSIIAHILMAKYVMGVPFYRLESRFEFDGVCVDRGTMCRYAEDTGATLGAIVLAARDEAFATSFCLSTDATGVSIQPTPLGDGKRQACRKGHFFVVLADRDHIFFEYQPKHTSATVCEMFRGYSGYIQADAHAIYDALYRGAASTEEGESKGPPTEVACWSHARRKFWEAATCKYQIGVDGLRRIDAIFAADRALRKLPPAQRHELRQQHVRPLVDAFLEWAKAAYATIRERGLVATALGYSVRQDAALRRFLEDGRLRLDNNASERELRRIAVGRKNWLFFGSDDHASAAANLFSLVASCKLHGLDPEAYLADVIRVMPYWPRERYIELAPKYWARTRARLDPGELARPLGHISVPGTPPPEEKPPTR